MNKSQKMTKLYNLKGLYAPCIIKYYYPKCKTPIFMMFFCIRRMKPNSGQNLTKQQLEVKGLSKTPPKYPLNIFKISPTYPQFVHQNTPSKYPQDKPQISPRCPPDITQICTRYPPNLPKINPYITIFLPDILQISPR